MKTKEEVRAFVGKAFGIQTEAKNLCVDILKEIGHPVEWDWNSDDAPSLVADCFGDDVADCYLTKIWLANGDFIKGNLHAYYLGEDREDVSLLSQIDVDWLIILDYLNNCR